MLSYHNQWSGKLHVCAVCAYTSRERENKKATVRGKYIGSSVSRKRQTQQTSNTRNSQKLQISRSKLEVKVMCRYLKKVKAAKDRQTFSNRSAHIYSFVYQISSMLASACSTGLMGGMKYKSSGVRIIKVLPQRTNPPLYITALWSGLFIPLP